MPLWRRLLAPPAPRLPPRHQPQKLKQEQWLPALESHLLRRRLLATVLRPTAREGRLLRSLPLKLLPLPKRTLGQAQQLFLVQRVSGLRVALESHLLRPAALECVKGLPVALESHLLRSAAP